MQTLLAVFCSVTGQGLSDQLQGLLANLTPETSIHEQLKCLRLLLKHC